jgi:SpoVK/Ycf46/Vps4 family AAA+-type ATPase
LDRIWNLSAIQPQQGRCILNFYGPPGTGKTRAALGIALRLGKPLYQVDYSAVISKYLGDTAKHIKAVFQAARDQDAVLFFDEADSLLSKRVATGESCSTSINQNRNTLMQELDRFDGVVIVTTNLFENYDPALLRRIQRHIHFRLPNASMRRELFAHHLPNPDRVTADYAVLAGLSRGLSGGDILNVCVNAIYAGSVDADSAKWAVTQGMIEAEIAKVKKAKAEHSGEKRKDRRRIGFQPG